MFTVEVGKRFAVKENGDILFEADTIDQVLAKTRVPASGDVTIHRRSNTGYLKITPTTVSWEGPPVPGLRGLEEHFVRAVNVATSRG